MKIVSAPISISFGIHLLIIASLMVMNSFFVSGEKLATIDLTVEDSIVHAAAGAAKGIGPEIKNKGPAMKKALTAAREIKVTDVPKQQPVQTKVMDQPKELPVEPKAAPPGPTIAQQDLLTGTEAPVAIPVAVSQSSGNNTGPVSGKTNTAAAQTGTGTGTGTGSSTGYGKSGSGTGSGSSGSSGTGGKSGYTNQQFEYIKELVQKKAFYPKVAKLQGWEGQVTLSFIIHLDGRVKDISVVKSSGREILDKSAMEAVKIASPFPRPPATVELKLPVTYKLLYDD